jgi:hypothetical protein
VRLFVCGERIAPILLAESIADAEHYAIADIIAIIALPNVGNRADFIKRADLCQLAQAKSPTDENALSGRRPEIG